MTISTKLEVHMTYRNAIRDQNRTIDSVKINVGLHKKLLFWRSSALWFSRYASGDTQTVIAIVCIHLRGSND